MDDKLKGFFGRLLNDAIRSSIQSIFWKMPLGMAMLALAILIGIAVYIPNVLTSRYSLLLACSATKQRAGILPSLSREGLQRNSSHFGQAGGGVENERRFIGPFGTLRMRR